MNTPYPGINAHLNNFLLQPDGGWEMFHAAHIIQLQQALDAVLPPNYYAAPEKSLQVVTQGLDDVALSRTIPDVSIYQTHKSDPARASESVTAPTAILPLVDVVLDDEQEINAVNIYQFEVGQI